MAVNMATALGKLLVDFIFTPSLIMEYMPENAELQVYNAVSG